MLFRSPTRLIYAYLLKRVGKAIESADLEKCLRVRTKPGERLSGDAASVGSDVNYLKKYYGYDIETVEPQVYKLHKPARPRDRR